VSAPENKPGGGGSTLRPPPNLPGPRDKPPRRRGLWLGLAAIPVVLLLLGVGFYAVLALNANNELKRDDTLMVGYDGRPTPGIGKNFLVLSQSAPNRTEVVMLVHRNALGNRLFLVSLPQNLLVDVDGKSVRLHDITNPGQVVKAVEGVFDARIEHVATMDIKGFVGLTESLGGLVVKNPHASTTATGISFPAGEINLRGEEALAFLNDESPMPDRDTVLAERQRSVLRALVLKVLKPETLANPITFNAVLNQVTEYVTVDRGLTSTEMWNLATSTHVKNSSDLVAAQAPIWGASSTAEGEEVALVDKDKARELGAALREDKMNDYSRRYPA
jgi:LCP family protein required for cell wall assembly